MNELVIGGVAIGGLLLLSSSGGGKPANVSAQTAGDAATAAMDALRAKLPLASVTWQVPTTNSPVQAYTQMAKAFVDHYGKMSGAANVVPTGLTLTQLVELGDAWIDVWQTGCSTSFAAETNFNLGDANTGVLGASTYGPWGTCWADQCDTVTGAQGKPTAIGTAVCSLRSYVESVRPTLPDILDEQTATDEQIAEMFRRINALANEMEAADYTFEGLRGSEKAASSDIIGGIGAGLKADVTFVTGVAGQAVADAEQVVSYLTRKSVGAVAGIAGDAAGAIAGAIVGSPLFWVAGLGLVAYLVLR